MNLTRHTLVAALWVAINCCPWSFAMGQTKGGEAFDVTLELINSAAEKKKVALYESYAQAVEKLQAGFQEAGRLQETLDARNEAENARKSQSVGDKDIPGIAKLRLVLADELSKIEASEAAKIEQARRKYIAFLKNRIVELTKEGSLDDAIRLSDVLKALEAKMADGLNPSNPSAASLPSAGPPVGELNEDEVLFGELTISGGNHRLRKELQIGYRKEKTDAEKGFLTIKDRARISGESIWTNFGTLVASDARFEDVLIQEELQGSFTANRCLFEECTFDKKGGWMVNWFGTKWNFDECVFKADLAGKNRPNSGCNP